MNSPRCVRGLSLYLVAHHQANKPIRDRPTKTNPVGTRNAVVTIATRTADERSSTVSCMERILHTTSMTVEPLSRNMRNAKRAAVETATTSAITRKGLQSKKGRGQRACAICRECDEQRYKQINQTLQKPFGFQQGKQVKDRLRCS